ncbi:MAG: hypothetical protein H9W81_07780 [Enterococcus sp.]|nr:hypothetical protein [Enterococcus sp.]
MSSYELAVEQAKAISPLAKVRLTRHGEAWEICIPSNFLSPATLPETYRGTPAWEKYNEPNGLYPNALLSWANYRKMLDKPIEYIADYYNLSQIQGEEMQKFAKELHKETGIADLDWDGEVSNEQFSQYKKNIETAKTMIDPTGRHLLDEKWSNLLA